MTTRAYPTEPLLAEFAPNMSGTARALVETPAHQQTIPFERLIGTWYVIASLSTGREKHIYQPTVHFALDDTGSSLSWRTIFHRIFKPSRRVLFVNDDYSQAVVSHGNKGVWILCRTPDMSCADFFRCAQKVREQGYDTRTLAFMPQTRGPKIP